MEGVRGDSVIGRAWFADADRAGRRLAVHAHLDRGRVSLSIWDGSTCRATFHLGVADAARLIHELADGLAAAAGAYQGAGAPSSELPSPLAQAVRASLTVLRRAEDWLARRGRPDHNGGDDRAAPPTLRALEDPRSE